MYTIYYQLAILHLNVRIASLNVSSSFSIPGLSEFNSKSHLLVTRLLQGVRMHAIVVANRAVGLFIDEVKIADEIYVQ